jgi:hypothetical protein
MDKPYENEDGIGAGILSFIKNYCVGGLTCDGSYFILD